MDVKLFGYLYKNIQVFTIIFEIKRFNENSNKIISTHIEIFMKKKKEKKSFPWNDTKIGKNYLIISQCKSYNEITNTHIACMRTIAVE